MGVLFAVLPGVISLGPRWLLLPIIMAGGLTCLLLLLADPTFPRRQWVRVGAIRDGWRGLLLRTLVVAAALVLFALATRGPDALLNFPRQRPRIWLGVALLYPVFSAFPQEIIYRPFFFHRYRALFENSWALIVVNAVLFGWSHIIVHNRIAMALATVGGLFFARTYERTRSTALVTLEHAAYGDAIFTIGIGGMFVNGVRLLSRILK